MPTIFTIPKPFNDSKINIIQRNAITGWTKLGRNFEIILIGDEPGIAEIAEELNLKHIREVKKNEFNTPLLSSAFALARNLSRSDILIYANSDIIFSDNLSKIFKYLPKNNFIAAGRRWDLEISELIDFDNPTWGEELKIKVKKNGRLHSSAGMDFYIFPKALLADLPDFAVGRVGWDNWVIYEAKRKKITLIDITEFSAVIHQTHDYPAFNQGAQRKINPEAKKNYSLVKDIAGIYTLEDADYKLTAAGLKINWLGRYSWLKRYLKYLRKKYFKPR
ncbi:hypothetical protein COX74_01375 [bacterium (Candidatus Gribaldobacteria) CG_4_10_14_0_2_um_filter_41_16]|uniref:Glycosyltransferase 2-like domain-containing protein n=1 Tax=bacterium (Candidatus Gribaldobacteria) CG_4_10_14_0_2_um_filter_41_16 TaxID=2014265 RepID=A0A2M7VIQ2_9BACT|nr:MAG: hypothetical protein COX74_01375 [bacterium (Candidatus Gribaldobacteria) CG_4_10_14_0_2_um_filter_41_16]